MLHVLLNDILFMFDRNRMNSQQQYHPIEYESHKYINSHLHLFRCTNAAQESHNITCVPSDGIMEGGVAVAAARYVNGRNEHNDAKQEVIIRLFVIVLLGTCLLLQRQL